MHTKDELLAAANEVMTDASLDEMDAVFQAAGLDPEAVLGLCALSAAQLEVATGKRVSDDFLLAFTMGFHLGWGTRPILEEE